jgi:ATP-dependent RNA helicase RhlE
MQQGLVKLNDIEILILDEVDRMLDVGFLAPMKRIIAKVPKKRQTLFFSATLPPEIAELANWALNDPVRIEIGAARSVASIVKHGVYQVDLSRKFDFLLALLTAVDFQSAIIFSRTKHGADKIAKRLRTNNHSVAVLHANRSQNQRIEALEGFKSGKYEVMVATDIAARGIDIAGVSHVINYDIPQHPEDYVHRIGRTGRANQSGDAFTLVTADEQKLWAGQIKEWMAVYQQAEDIINIGAYAKGSNPKIDQAMAVQERIQQFLRQKVNERGDFQESLGLLHGIYRSGEAFASANRK